MIFTVNSTRQREKIAAIAANIKEKTQLSPSGTHYVATDVALTAPGRERYVIKADKKVRAWYLPTRNMHTQMVKRPVARFSYDFSKLYIALEDRSLQLTLQLIYEGDALVTVTVTVQGHTKERPSSKNYRSTKSFDSHNK